jgi:putative restriction endonuclease
MRQLRAILRFVAYGLGDYLDLDADEARRQWGRIGERVALPRQEAFLPVETILCYGLFFILDPHRFGGSNADRLPETVRAIAKACRRPANSLTHKMLNLDGSLPHAGRTEPQLFVRLAARPDVFAALYLTVLNAARQAGFGPESVPDFLAGEDGEVVMLGQEELGGREIGQALDEQRETIATLGRDLDFVELDTVRLVEQQVRLGQHRFARDVLENYDHRCAFCGFSARALPRHGLMLASHIKPWSKSTGRERLDPRNGVAACPVHDAAFDGGLLTINGGMRIHRAGILLAAIPDSGGAERFFGDGAIRPNLGVPDGGLPPLERYLRVVIPQVLPEIGPVIPQEIVA